MAITTNRKDTAMSPVSPARIRKGEPKTRIVNVRVAEVAAYRSEAARKANASRSPEERSRAACIAQSNRTPEERSESARKAQAGRTAEQRTQAARRAAASRAARVAALGDPNQPAE